jgi:Zn-dependent protease
LGAFVRLKQHPANPREDAEVGLAGPVWGAGATLAAWVASLATGWGALAAIAHASAWLNLFNLLPIGPLDGGRGFRALSRSQRWLVAAALGGMWFWTAESLLVVLLVVAVGRALAGEAPQQGDRRAALTFVGLVVVLSLLCLARPAGLTTAP